MSLLDKGLDLLGFAGSPNQPLTPEVIDPESPDINQPDPYASVKDPGWGEVLAIGLMTGIAQRASGNRNLASRMATMYMTDTQIRRRKKGIIQTNLFAAEALDLHKQGKSPWDVWALAKKYPEMDSSVYIRMSQQLYNMDIDEAKEMWNTVQMQTTLSRLLQGGLQEGETREVPEYLQTIKVPGLKGPKGLMRGAPVEFPNPLAVTDQRGNRIFRHSAKPLDQKEEYVAAMRKIWQTGDEELAAKWGVTIEEAKENDFNAMQGKTGWGPQTSFEERMIRMLTPIYASFERQAISQEHQMKFGTLKSMIEARNWDVYGGSILSLQYELGLKEDQMVGRLNEHPGYFGVDLPGGIGDKWEPTPLSTIIDKYKTREAIRNALKRGEIDQPTAEWAIFWLEKRGK